MNGLKCAQWVQALIKECYSTFACSRTFANVLGAPPSADKAELLQWRPRECRHARIYMVKYLKFYYHHNKYLFNFHNYSIFQEVYHSGSGPGSWSKVNDTRYKTKDIYHLFRGHKHSFSTSESRIQAHCFSKFAATRAQQSPLGLTKSHLWRSPTLILRICQHLGNIQNS